jgi:hypothetical protein
LESQIYTGTIWIVWLLHLALFVVFLRWIIFFAREKRAGVNGVTSALLVFSLALITNEVWSLIILYSRVHFFHLLSDLATGQFHGIEVAQCYGVCSEGIRNNILRIFQLGLLLGGSIWSEVSIRRHDEEEGAE